VLALVFGESKEERGPWAQIKISNATECIVRAKIFKKEACVIMAE